MERPRTVALAVVLLLGLLIPTGAVLLSDDLFGDESIVLEPHTGPNGEYVEVGQDGNLSVDLGDPGVNQEASTVVEDVFNVSNQGSTTSRVWITHDATGHVTFQDGEGRSIQGKENNVSLAPGETLVVSMRVDSKEAAAGDVLLRDIAVHAEIEDETTTTTTTTATTTTATTTTQENVRTTTSTPTRTSTPVAPPLPTPTPAVPTPEVPIAEEEDVEVDFEGDDTGVDVGGEGVTVVEIDPASLDDLPGESDETGPRAVVQVEDEDAVDAPTGEEPTADGQPDPEAARQQRIRDRLQTVGANALTQVGEPVSLSGEQSLLGSTRGIDDERRIVRAVDIRVPPERQNRPGTVRIATERSKFAGTDPSQASIAHRSEEGWQLLDTRVVRMTETQVVLEARTPSFSPFAVFADNEVSYQWQLPNGDTFDGKRVRTQFDEPGFYNVSLTVTDAFGRSSTTPYRILVNDPPALTVETVGNVTAGAPVTLRAEVENEIGDVNVTWTFPDGTELTGDEVEYTFEPGEHVVEAVAEDEFGATEQAELTVGVPLAAGGDPYADVRGLAGRFEAWLALFALLVALLLTLRRWTGGVRPLPGGGFRGLLPAAVRRDPPRITSFEAVRVDLARARFEIGRLRVEDRNGDLQHVEVVVSDFRGNEVGRRSIEVGEEPEYAERNVVVTPTSKVYVRADQEYRVRVSATDRRGATDERTVTVAADVERRDGRRPGLRESRLPD